MKKNVSHEQIRSARRADLYAFLAGRHGSEFKREGDSLRPKNNHSISIRKGYCGYTDFATGETGNSLDFLTGHMGYSFTEAVQALSGRPADEGQTGAGVIPPDFPAPTDGGFGKLFAFLTNRGIPAETIRRLSAQGIMYQEKKYGSIVFINAERDFAEIRGTCTYGRPFHGVAANCRHDGFWWFRTSKDAYEAYICEAAIDAISLYELHKCRGRQEPAYYISIAGVAKQAAIDRLKQSDLTLTLAVDNDGAGDRCRDRNPGLGFTLPSGKDWNEDLQALKKEPVSP